MSSKPEDFIAALKTIRADKELSHKFLQDPHGTLKAHGVTVGKSATAAAGATPALGVCVGACVCVG